MIISKAVDMAVIVRGILVLLTLLSLHVFVVSALLSLGQQREISADDNVLLEAAVALSIANPDALAALALYQRKQALLNDGEARTALLTASLGHWQSAIAQRPAWPYHHLGALDIEVLLNKPAAVIQQRIDKVILQTPNERGIDKPLLELAIFSWGKLTPVQREWMVKRLNIADGSVLKFVIKAADRVKRKSLMCAHLPLKKARWTCR